jgi:hypothetical protein
LFSNIQERIQIASNFSGGTTNTLNYGNGAIMMIPTTATVASNYTLNIVGLPTMAASGDITKTYVVSTINTSTSVANNASNTIIANVVTVNGSAALPIYFGGGVSTIPTTTANVLVQQIAIISSGGTPIALSSVTQYK